MINNKLSLMFVFLFFIPLVFADDEIFKIDESKDFKFSLLYSNGSFVTGYDCNNTLYFPNESILINNVLMTYDFYSNLYNITYNFTSSGFYTSKVNCYNGDDSKQYFFTINVVEDYNDGWFNALMVYLSNFWDFISGEFININSNLTSINGTVFNNLDSINDSINNLEVSVDLTDVFNNLTSINDSINNLNFSVDLTDVFNNLTSINDSIFNNLISINDSINNLNFSVDLTDISNDIGIIKKIQICYFKQYEQIEDYYTYCVDYKDKFNVTEIKRDREIELNITSYLLNKTIANAENTYFDGSNCFNLDKYKNLINSTNYFALNIFLASSSYSIDSLYCFGRLFFKMLSGVKNE